MTNSDEYPLLDSISSPADVRKLSKTQLESLSDEVRRYLTHTVSLSGGHFSAGLGTVELTVALHYVFNTPIDKLVWDVGHQAYPHKILTGRKDKMPTIRTKGGICAFPKRSESEYDAFGVGHSSTSISAALGMAIAAKQKGDNKRMVAIIGDGSITGGMAFEAMNHAGVVDANLLVILNDNNMAISPNVGAMNNYFTRVISSKLYSSVREESKKVLSKMPSVWELAKKTEEHVKGMIVPGTLFEELGFNYIGPIDGHDLDTLISTLSNLRERKGPQFLHIVTKKGKGFEPAEQQPGKYHGVSPAGSKVSGPTYTQVFGQWLCDMAAQSKDLMAITPAMCDGSGLNEFAEQYPDRYFDVGIAEQHAVTLAAGIACEGKHPVVAIYSTFLQRGYDQLIHDVALQNLPVLFAIDRGGLVGADGATHAGTFDLSYLRCIPNMVVMAASDENECRQMLTTGYKYDGPAAVRYPRGSGPGTKINPELSSIEIGKADIKRTGEKIAILAFGSMLQASLEAAETLNATVVNMRFVKPLDQTIIKEMADNHNLIITIEENTCLGGAGSGVAEYLHSIGDNTPIKIMGLPDKFLDHGDHKKMLANCNLNAQGIINTANNHFAA